MSHYPRHSMGFFDTIQVYFMELTGRAIMFSGRDLALLMEWREKGASAAVICRGLRDAFTGMDEGDPPRNIYNCRSFIEPWVERARERATGAAGSTAGSEPAHHAAADASDANTSDVNTSDAPTPASPHAALFDRALANIEQAGSHCEREAFRQVYRDAWRRLRSLRDDDAVADPFEELLAIQDALLDGFYAALDEAERQQIEDTLLDENRAIIERMSAAARREHLLARRRLHIARAYNIHSLLE